VVTGACVPSHNARSVPEHSRKMGAYGLQLDLAVFSAEVTIALPRKPNHSSALARTSAVD